MKNAYEKYFTPLADIEDAKGLSKLLQEAENVFLDGTDKNLETLKKGGEVTEQKALFSEAYTSIKNKLPKYLTSNAYVTNTGQVKNLEEINGHYSFLIGEGSKRTNCAVSKQKYPELELKE